MITLRLTSSSFAGTWRTLVAVGTAMLASIFVAITAETPRNGSGSTTSKGVCSTGAIATTGRGARGGASGEIGSLIADVATFFNSGSGNASKLDLDNSPVGSAFAEPTGL